MYDFYSLLYTASATPAIYTLSLHDALPICDAPDNARYPVGHGGSGLPADLALSVERRRRPTARGQQVVRYHRSEEHTSELQSRPHLVCRLLLEKKKIKDNIDELI